MKTRNLRIFVEVVRQGGFSQAAKVVFATQSTVSKAVKQLEDELRVPLLDRIGHRSSLTAAGEIVYRRALKMLADQEDLTAELEALRGLKRGRLRLGLPPVGSSILFAPLFAVYRERYPNIEIRLVEHGADRLAEILEAGEIDLAAALLPLAGAFESQEVRREPIVAVLSAHHSLARRKSVSFADLRRIPFILFESGFALNRIILDGCARRGFEPRIVARSSQIDFIIELAASGLGVAFLPALIAENRRHAGVRTALLAEPNMEWRIAMIWRREAYLPESTRAWLALTKECHQALPPILQSN
ncbi:LysR family transcriptional regulator [Methylocystis bryophila]|uniref:LysR family transcriptional regulator n=1 Tax=Methylocystis bryophila TaxID=655015 RepID=A0A1W6N1H2_9HYPH|nr:LysR family transcriptional regulator [Methylocystis bryophila]ARN83658.1 LysR family transcriptional regulator [Methylocystis bryophila]